MERRNFLKLSLAALFGSALPLKCESEALADTVFESITAPTMRGKSAFISARYLHDERWDIFGRAMQYVEAKSGLQTDAEDLNNMCKDLERLGMKVKENITIEARPRGFPVPNITLAGLGRAGKLLRISREGRRFTFDYVDA